MRGPLRLAVVAACACACAGAGDRVAPPVGQIVLYVDTDAPIVPADGHPPATSEALPLFDRLRLDVVGPAGATCDGCSQDFAVDADAFAQGRVSAGLVPPVGQIGWSVRVRLYLQRFSPVGGDPNADASLDATFALPATGAEGIVELTAMMATDWVGQPQTSGTSLAAGPPGASQVGSWAKATRTPCSKSPPAAMVCIPGGAFWMGSAASDLPPGSAAGWHRLVVVSPFFLDATEMTVTSARALGIDEAATGTWSGSSTGASAADFCTYTPSAGPRDGLPLNCVSQVGARLLCRRRGVDLPTETQLEYAMGGLRGEPFVWGVDPPGCGDAVWGRNGSGILKAGIPQQCRASTNYLGVLGGPEPPGRGARDTLDAGSGSVVDLDGNLAEWARDAYEPQTGDCWSTPGVLVDPACTATVSLSAERGGAWTSGGAGLEAAGRVGASPTGEFYDVGLRCAASAL